MQTDHVTTAIRHPGGHHVYRRVDFVVTFSETLSGPTSVADVDRLAYFLAAVELAASSQRAGIRWRWPHYRRTNLPRNQTTGDGQKPGSNGLPLGFYNERQTNLIKPSAVMYAAARKRDS
ncbi:hypothetical protein NDU88_003293 [Pleurodeles waltl]|uniref:Uncharacterized protein n=1 Tax=Pleurodeles waltl TaxID=8319 RepID=A0AAV7UY17_PLEWA|nr:hypothetical protein NDU88_003293 [Pleurodeles waltl]